MGGLLVAEFRKTLTTKLWWALMIPAVLLAFAFSLGWGAFANGLDEVLGSSEMRLIAQALGISTGTLPTGLLAIGHGINVGLTFAVIFGVFALAGEYRGRTITTTFLTAPNRVSVLAAKMITYVVWGAVYGLAVAAVSSLGIVFSVNNSGLPTAAQWLWVFAASMLAGVLSTLFGIGVGAVWNSVVGSVVTLVIYLLLIENTLVLFGYGQWDIAWLGAVLPNGTMNGIVGAIGAQAFGAAGVKLPGLEEKTQWWLQYIAGAPGAVSWWASALVFALWTAVFFAGGWLVNQRRDIT
ncbi:ABC transporter permease subunit [Amycolatopsis pithecellobii]|uniref:ABC transporter permease subunit n=1 Tax=Amycolatopsis pithecellobii TaxID=664692 RepID=A0A6N7Z9U9_9PSEU|nr:ABC transporter permease subunit [Amycolatopsis pithecellobii]MTD58503.1 ABC transporter permease subunit [Amycolatopsis pithecellobii]